MTADSRELAPASLPDAARSRAMTAAAACISGRQVRAIACAIRSAVTCAAVLLAIFLASVEPGAAQGTATWAKNFGTAASASHGAATAVDGSGNVYIAGTLSGATLTLGSVTLTKIGTTDLYAAKLDSAGTVIWAKNFGGTGATIESYAIATDATGNVYLGGHFSGANLTTPALTKIGTKDAFAIKLDSTGAVTWGRNFGGTGASVTGYDIAVDTAGNVYLGGDNSGNLTTPALTGTGVQDAYVLKLDSTGAVTWAKNFGRAGANSITIGTAVDSSGNIYIGGQFNGVNLTLGSVTLTRIGSVDAFAAKLDSTGTVTWAKNFGGAGASATSNGRIAVDGSGNVYLGGTFSGANLTTPALTKIGTQDAYALKLDSTGAVTWGKNFGGIGSSVTPTVIAVDGSGNIYLGGDFSGAGLTTPSLIRIGTGDVLAIKLDSTGATSWTAQFGGTGSTAGANGMAVDASGNVHLAGTFFTASLTAPALTKIGTSDAFILKTSSGSSSSGGVTTPPPTWVDSGGGNGSPILPPIELTRSSSSPGTSGGSATLPASYFTRRDLTFTMRNGSVRSTPNADGTLTYRATTSTGVSLRITFAEIAALAAEIERINRKAKAT